MGVCDDRAFGLVIRPLFVAGMLIRDPFNYFPIQHEISGPRVVHGRLEVKPKYLLGESGDSASLRHGDQFARA